MTRPPVPPYRVWLGWDASQLRANVVAAWSAQSRTRSRLDVRRLSLSALQAEGWYTRPTSVPPDGRPGLWDVISGAPMATGHAIARFLVPALCDYQGWALFADGDILVRRDLGDLFALADPRYAVQVVQHGPLQAPGLKMDGVEQTSYPRKNWSSVMLWHCAHPANRALDVGLVNRLPGRDLHRFCWLDDTLVGALPPSWNHLVGVSALEADPALVHFTEGLPDMPGYERSPYADEWYAVAKTCGYNLARPEVPA